GDEPDETVSNAERGAWITADADVGVELPAAGRESLRIATVGDQRTSVANQQRARLEEVATRLARQLGARSDRDPAVIDVDARAQPVPGARERHGADARAADAELSQRFALRPREEAAHDRLGDAVA